MREPSWDGYFADPFVLRHPSGFYAYGTSRPADGSLGFEAMFSTDLITWRPIGQVLHGVPDALGDSFWAPEVVEHDGSFWMYFSVGHGIDGHHLRVARASSPAGPFVDQGVNLTPDEPFAIDPSPFRDEDGAWYLYFARDDIDAERPGTHLAVARLDGMTKLAGPIVPVLAPDADWQLYERGRAMYGRALDWHTLEGPFVVRRGGRYVLFFSGGSWEGEGYGVSYATADGPLGPWMHEVAPAADILSSALVGLPGPGHNSVLATDDGDLIVFHAWNADLTMRQLHLASLRWDGSRPSLG